MVTEPGEEEPGEEEPGEGPGKEEESGILDPLDEIQKMVSKFAEGIEIRLLDSLNKAVEGINAKIEANAGAATELTSKAKAAIEAMPALIQTHVETQLKTNLTGIVEEVGKQFEAKVKAMAGGGSGDGGGAGGAMSLNQLLNNSDKIIGVINAFRSPTTEQAMVGQMNLIFRWHGLLSKLEKGGGSGEDITKAIADTFIPPAQG